MATLAAEAETAIQSNEVKLGTSKQSSYWQSIPDARLWLCRTAVRNDNRLGRKRIRAIEKNAAYGSP